MRLYRKSLRDASHTASRKRQCADGNAKGAPAISPPKAECLPPLSRLVRVFRLELIHKSRAIVLGGNLEEIQYPIDFVGYVADGERRQCPATRLCFRCRYVDEPVGFECQRKLLTPETGWWWIPVVQRRHPFQAPAWRPGGSCMARTPEHRVRVPALSSHPL